MPKSEDVLAQTPNFGPCPVSFLTLFLALVIKSELHSRRPDGPITGAEKPCTSCGSMRVPFPLTFDCNISRSFLSVQAPPLFFSAWASVIPQSRQHLLAHLFFFAADRGHPGGTHQMSPGILHHPQTTTSYQGHAISMCCARALCHYRCCAAGGMIKGGAKEGPNPRVRADAT